MWISLRWGLIAAGGLVLLAAVIQLLEASLWQALGHQILLWQKSLHRDLTLAITDLARGPSATAWMTMLGLSFGYGVFHAAGPGHGKAVLSTYLASHGGASLRAIGLSFAASLMQGVTAIVMVVVLVFALGWMTRQAMGSTALVEQASFMLVAALGAYLCVRAAFQLRRAYAPPSPAEAGSCHHCGGPHHIEPDQALDWRTALMTVMSIGIRPCSGGVLMLGAASLLGQFAMGVAAVVAMSIGTGITVSALAMTTTLARGWAQRRLATQQGARRLARLSGWLALAGGILILAMGITLSLAGIDQGASPLLNAPARQGTVLGQ